MDMGEKETFFSPALHHTQKLIQNHQDLKISKLKLQ